MQKLAKTCPNLQVAFFLMGPKIEHLALKGGLTPGTVLRVLNSAAKFGSLTCLELNTNRWTGDIFTTIENILQTSHSLSSVQLTGLQVAPGLIALVPPVNVDDPSNDHSIVLYLKLEGIYMFSHPLLWKLRLSSLKSLDLKEVMQDIALHLMGSSPRLETAHLHDVESGSAPPSLVSIPSLKSLSILGMTSAMHFMEVPSIELLTITLHVPMEVSSFPGTLRGMLARSFSPARVGRIGQDVRTR